jgi:hypothetical protein
VRAKIKSILLATLIWLACLACLFFAAVTYFVLTGNHSDTHNNSILDYAVRAILWGGSLISTGFFIIFVLKKVRQK